jgi:CRP-like cAMP-binding protein
MSDLPEQHPLTPMITKLEEWRPLDDADRQAALDLPHRVIRLRPHEYIVRDGDTPQHSCLMLSGFSFRNKVAGNGGRQVFSIHMRGDLADLQNSLLGVADHNLQALDHVKAAMIPVTAIQDLAFKRPAIGRAMWFQTLVDASIFREWTLNVNRRDAKTRAAHLLCEFALRLEASGLGDKGHYELPMTQEQLADALGLTSVHTNRTLMALGSEGLITRTKRSVLINDWAQLARVGDFNPAYLHLSKVVPGSSPYGPAGV